MSEVSMEKDNSFWRTGNPVSFSFKMLWCQICLLLGILSLTAVSFFKPFSVSGTECGLSGRFQDNYYKGVSFSIGEQGHSQRLVTPWKSFSPTFPSSCLFWSPELGFLSPTQSVPICVQVSLPTSVEFCPQPFQMRLTWKKQYLSPGWNLWCSSDHVHHLFCSWGLCPESSGLTSAYGVSQSARLDFYYGLYLEKAMAPPSSTPAWKIPWRSLVGCSPWGREELDTTERLHFHFSLSCIGEGNGDPLQCSCLENPRDGGAWWAAIYAVAQSRTQLKRLGSSSGLYSPSFLTNSSSPDITWIRILL